MKDIRRFKYLLHILFAQGVPVVLPLESIESASAVDEATKMIRDPEHADFFIHPHLQEEEKVVALNLTQSIRYEIVPNPRYRTPTEIVKEDSDKKYREYERNLRKPGHQVHNV